MAARKSLTNLAQPSGESARPKAALAFAEQVKSLFNGEDVARIIAEEMAKQKLKEANSMPKINMAETETLIKELATKDQVVVGDQVQGGVSHYEIRDHAHANFIARCELYCAAQIRSEFERLCAPDGGIAICQEYL